MVSTNEVVNEIAPVEVQKQPAAVQETDAAQPTINVEDDFEKAQKLFQLGKKNLLLNKYADSVNNISEACKAYATKFGDMDPQCAEVYFFYGRALLELARMENTVLGNALSGVPEESEPINDSRYGNPEEVAVEEKNEIAEKVIDAMCSGDEEMKNGNETKNGDEAAKTETAAAEVTETIASSAATTTTTTEVASSEKATTEETATPVVVEGEKVAAAAVVEGEEGEGEEEEEGDDCEEEDEAAEGDENKEDGEDEVTNLQSSWEMFELAKVIYTKNFNDDTLLKNKRIAECLLKLGEIGIEKETYEQAINDISESIRVQEEIACADRDERMLAESYYQLGLARQFSELCAEANEAYQRAINIVQLRIEKLRGRLLTLPEPVAVTDGTDAATTATTDANYERTSINDEIAELEALVPDLTSKLEEVNEQNQAAVREAREQLAKQMENKLASGAVVPPTTAENGEFKDITCMVKSKRKIESDEVGSTKKTRLSEDGSTVVEDAENKENKVDEVTATATVNGETTPATVVAEKVEEVTAAVVEQPATTVEPAATAEPVA